MVKVVSAGISHSCTGIKWAEKNENAPDSKSHGALRRTALPRKLLTIRLRSKLLLGYGSDGPNLDHE